MKKTLFIRFIQLSFFLSIVGWSNAFAQEKTVSGTVTDQSTGDPLPGVNIVVKGTSKGTITNIDGQYTINVANDDAVLVFSYIGFLAKEQTVGSRSTIDVEMETDITSLQEVVVIGYGVVKKRDLTGSVVSVKSEDIVQVPTFNPIEAIQGKASGVDIVRSSGEAGASAEVRIRGNRSIGGSNEPLYIIDGFQGGNINNLNPNDIESIEVLKDASATAIYGSQGANGVIIVTTKKGDEGKAKVSYDAYYGVNGLTPFPERRLGEDFIQLRREAYRTAGEWSSPADDRILFDDNNEWEAYQAGQWVDWTDLLMRNGTQQSHTVSVNGGTESTKIYASAGLFKEEGMYRLNDISRYNARLNLDQKLADWAKVGLLSQVTYTDHNRRRDPLSDAISTLPLGVPYDENGEININPVPGNTNVVSPLADEIPNAAKDNTNTTNVSLNAFLELAPIEGLTIRSNFGSNLGNNRRGEYYSADSYTRRNQRTSIASITAGYDRFFHWDNVVNYTREIADHSFTVTGITSYTEGVSDYVYASGLNQQLSSQLFYNIAGTDLNGRYIESGYEKTNTMSYAGRLNYSYKGKYLLTVTNRIDGASRLAPGNKWASFPSVAVGWNISEEAFMTQNAISLLKLRASYGLTGNSGIPPYGTQSLLVGSPRMGFGDEPAYMYRFSGTVGNAKLGWELSATTNVGLDLGLLDDRITATVDVYDTKTTDLLMPRTLPQSTGVSMVYQNIGSTRNRGFELAVSSVNVDNGDFSWNSSLTFSRNKEQITELIDGKDIIDDEDNSLLIGHPIESFYTYNKLGIWQISEADEAASYSFGSETGAPFAPGDIKLRDLNNDNIISADDDRSYVGSTVPEWVAGLKNSFRYKGFELDVFLFARYGQTINAEFLGRYRPEGDQGSLALFDYWTPENPTNDFPRPRRSSLSGIAGYQTLTFVDGSYFKVRNVTLGYNLPKSLTQKFFVENLRVYVTGSNLLVLSKNHLLKNYDPEGGGAESYPINRQIVFGVNIDF